MTNLILRCRFWLILKLWPFGKCGSHFCANRQEWTFVTPNRKAEFKLQIRNLTQQDGYSRTELLQMLQLIRAEEQRQDWQVPDPREHADVR